MNQELINTVMYGMNDCLSSQQLLKLKQVLEDATREADDGVNRSEEYLEQFCRKASQAVRVGPGRLALCDRVQPDHGV